MEQAIDIEAEPKTTAIAVREANQAVGILRPADSLDRIAEAFKEYQRVCETILDKSDYQAYEGKPRKKKSAWRKLATAFNVSTQVVKEEIERTETRHVLSASYTVCAYTGPKASPYRQFEAVGYCDINEKCCASARGEKCHKAAWKGHYCCVKGCDGRKHWSHPDHDVKSTAQTRATNRAIADLIGCGEVSAEELVDETPQDNAPTPAGAPGRSKAPTTPPKAAPTPTPAQKPATAVTKLPTAQTRAWAINELKANPGEANHDTVVEYFRALSQLMPNEEVTDLPLRFVPATHAELRALVTAIGDFSNGDRALAAFKPHNSIDCEPPKWEDVPEKPDAPSKWPEKPVEVPRDKPVPPKPPKVIDRKDPLWWKGVIVPVPHRGEKRADYMRNPETIGFLYDQRHEQTADGEDSRRRLFGFIQNYEAKGWQKQDGTAMPPSEGDILFREALDACAEYHEREHPDEKL